MDLDAVKARKNLEDLEDYKSSRFLGFFFWILPLAICAGSFGFGPIIGSIVTVITLALCIPPKSRFVMYFVFNIILIISGIFNGLGGIIGSVIICGLYCLFCVHNYNHLKQVKEIKEYERIMSN